ncbi:MAG: phosphate ABC transporter substrate-binding protein [Candidatus Binatia bacterium]
MHASIRRAVHSVLVLAFCTSASNAGAALRVNGSTTVNLPVAEVAEILRAERGMDIQVDTQGGSAGGIAMLGDGLVDVAMASKPLGDADRAKYPRVHFTPVQIGADAVALIASRDVWDAGVRALSKEQVRDIYEGRITNWKQVGGPERRIAFFNKEPGRGTWEVFAHWLYGDSQKAPPVSFPEVGGNEETRNKAGSTRGALSQLSASWADGRTVFALGLAVDGGIVVMPTPENIASHRYPMSRPLFVITNGEPSGEARVLIDFLLSERGQALVRKHGYLSLEQLQH